MQRSRPTSLLEVSQIVSSGGDYVSAVKEFIDEIAAELKKFGTIGVAGLSNISTSAYDEEPVYLQNAVHRAHIAGMAEYLANLAGREPPEWCLQPCYFLEDPVFLGGRHAHSLVMAETPAAFRRRLLFCGKSMDAIFVALGIR